jgi:hypothetical protein
LNPCGIYFYIPAMERWSSNPQPRRHHTIEIKSLTTSL